MSEWTKRKIMKQMYINVEDEDKDDEQMAFQKNEQWTKKHAYVLNQPTI